MSSPTVASVIDELHLRRRAEEVIADWLTVNADALADAFVHTSGEDVCIQARNADDMAAYVRILAAGAPLGTVTKKVSDSVASCSRHFGPLEVRVYAMRDSVCERKVVGTETVEVPDPDAPLVTVEREVFEWECKPLLSVSA